MGSPASPPQMPQGQARGLGPSCSGEHSPLGTPSLRGMAPLLPGGPQRLFSHSHSSDGPCCWPKSASCSQLPDGLQS